MEQVGAGPVALDTCVFKYFIRLRDIAEQVP